MAAVGAEVTSSWFLSSGAVSLFILLLLLSIFLTSLCSDCGRRSFELQDSKVEKNPSALIKVVKLEDAMMARENPIINEIQNDEKESHHNETNNVQATAWRDHLGAPPVNQDLKTEEENCVQFTPWRSHLTDVNSFTAPDSDHIYHTISAQQSSGDASSPPANRELRSATAEDSSSGNMTSVYAQVSKKVTKSTTTTTVCTPTQVQEEEEEEEEEKSSPPLPGRTTEMEG